MRKVFLDEDNCPGLAEKIKQTYSSFCEERDYLKEKSVDEIAEFIKEKTGKDIMGSPQDFFIDRDYGWVYTEEE